MTRIASFLRALIVADLHRDALFLSALVLLYVGLASVYVPAAQIVIAGVLLYVALRRRAVPQKEG